MVDETDHPVSEKIVQRRAGLLLEPPGEGAHEVDVGVHGHRPVTDHDADAVLADACRDGHSQRPFHLHGAPPAVVRRVCGVPAWLVKGAPYPTVARLHLMLVSNTPRVHLDT